MGEKPVALYDVVVSLLLEAKDPATAMARARMALTGFDVDYNFLIHHAELDPSHIGLAELRSAAKNLSTTPAKAESGTGAGHTEGEQK